MYSRLSRRSDLDQPLVGRTGGRSKICRFRVELTVLKEHIHRRFVGIDPLVDSVVIPKLGVLGDLCGFAAHHFEHCLCGHARGKSVIKYARGPR